MLTFVEAVERESTITIDGYTSNKTPKGLIKDVARALEKYDMGEAEEMHSMAKEFDPEFNTPFLESSSSDEGYFFEYEEVSCASKWNEEKDEIEYKDGFYNYFCIRIVK